MPDDPQHLLADADGVVVEVDRVDVLVLLGRVLGVGDGPVDAGGEPLRVLGDPGVVRRRLQGEVERHLEAEAVGGRHERRGSPPRCRGRGGSRRARRRGSRSPRVSRGRRGRASACCWVPCGTWCRSGGSAAGRRRRTPWRRLRAAARRRSGRCRCARVRPSTVAPSLRGKSSYQAPQVASGRSTKNGYGSDEETNSRSGYPASTSSMSPCRAGASRASSGRETSSRASITPVTISRAARSALRRRRPIACSRRRITRVPSANISSVSMPAGILMEASCRHVATGSLQPCTRNAHIPSTSGVKLADQRSGSWTPCTIRTGGRSAPPGSRKIASAFTAS